VPLIDATPLPSPGECSLAGVAGDELAVHRPQGPELVLYTLWGEIAFQVGGPDTGMLAIGRSRAEIADGRNPHPAGFP
jgi:hypothetical protein